MPTATGTAMEGGKQIKLGLAEVQVLIAVVIHSLKSGFAKSNEQGIALANLGLKLRSLEKQLLKGNNS